MKVGIECPTPVMEKPNPQREHGHIDIANEIARHLCRVRFSGQEWQIIWAVLHQTWGQVAWDEKGEAKRDSRGWILKLKMAHLTASRMAKMTGLSRKRCHDIASKLAARKILKKFAPKIGGNVTVMYGFNKHYDQWEMPPKKGARPKKAETGLDAPNKGGKLPPIKGARNPEEPTSLPPILGHNTRYILQDNKEGLRPPPPAQLAMHSPGSAQEKEPRSCKNCGFEGDDGCTSVLTDRNPQDPEKCHSFVRKKA